MYRTLFHRSAEKNLKKIFRGDRSYAEKIAEEIKGLKQDPRPINSIQIEENFYRLRIGNYRVLHAIVDKHKVVIIGKITRRSESTYKDIKSLAQSAIASMLKDLEG